MGSTETRFQPAGVAGTDALAPRMSTGTTAADKKVEELSKGMQQKAQLA